MRNHWITTMAVAVATLVLVAGCRRDEVQVYRLAKDQTPTEIPTMNTGALPPGHPDVAAGQESAAPLTWKTPAGWTEVPATELRVASFKVNKDGKMVDVSVIPLAGMAGTDEANVNRWRGQVGLSAVSADDLHKSGETVDVGGQPAQLYDITGTNPASGEKLRIVAVIQHRPDSTWFFKMTGDAELGEQQKPSFLEFLKSLKFSAAPAAQAGMPATLPPNHPAIGDMTAPPAGGPVSHEGQPGWQVPAGWQEIAGGQFLVAKFIIAANGAQAAVNVSSSAGDGGGLAPNITRWRGQLGLPPTDDFSATQIDVDGGKGQRVDLEGTTAGKPAKMVAVIVPREGQAWFYKLMGDPKVVDSQKDAFIKFVQSAKY
ncbi:MAG TPA: hypothetical protein VN625_01700 [Desulfuromonadaceae bacterium]|nr:hypothetical protein [Desulfuromonadaceae bacterium]